MNRRKVFASAARSAGIGAVLATGLAPAVHAQPAVRWRLASSFPKSLDTLFGSAETLSKSVRAMSGGRFDISVHPAGELVPAFGVVDAVQNGTVEIAHTAPYYFFGKDETFTLGCAIPFGLNSRQLSAWMLEGNGGRLMQEFYARYGIVNFPAGNTGAQMGGWFRKQIQGARDLQGLKFRIAGFAGRIMERLGAVPQSIPGGEIYQALEKGTIDAAEWVGPYDDQKLGFVKVAPNYYYPGFWEGAAQLDFFIHQKAWDALPAELKAIVEAASAQAHAITQARYDARNPVALKQLVSQGARLRPFPADVMAQAFRHAQDIYAETSARNENFRKVYTDFARFRADQNLWFRFTEASFDRFMQAQKL